jgi:hypothetical protein
MDPVFRAVFPFGKLATDLPAGRQGAAELKRTPENGTSPLCGPHFLCGTLCAEQKLKLRHNRFLHNPKLKII